MVNGQEKIEQVNRKNFYSSSFSLREFNLKLRRGIGKNGSPSFNFLANRVVNDCNCLPELIVRI